MINITERAQQHFRHLLTSQSSEGLGIRLQVTAPGTLAADCELAFCENAELDGSEYIVECEGFNFYIEGASATWLEDAQIDDEPNTTGGQLNIRAPKIKGETPSADADLAERVRYVLEAEINPQIAAHGGRVNLIAVEAPAVVLLQFGGGCHGCGMADVTLKNGVEKTLRARIPQITAVRDITDHTQGSQPYYRTGEGRSAIGDS